MDVTKDPKFQYFIQQRGELSPNTIKVYRQDLTLYSRFTGKTLSELIEEGRREQEKYNYLDERKLPSYLISFKEHLVETGHTKYRVKKVIQDVKTFYREFEIDTPRLKLKGVPESHYVLYDELPQWEDIRKVITLSNVRYRALFSFMASSGMNTVDARKLTIGDLLNAVNYFFNLKGVSLRINDLDSLINSRKELKGVIPVWRVWRVKVNYYHLTFSSPESLQFILDYLNDDPPLDESTPLFRMHKSQMGIKYDLIRKYISKINEKAGWKGKKIGAFQYVTTKTFRTFFGNELEDEEVRHEHIRLMMGHRQPGVTDNYFKKNAIKMLESYIKGVHRLTFMEKLQVVDHTTEEIKKLKERNMELESSMDLKLAALEHKLMEQYKREFQKLP